MVVARKKNKEVRIKGDNPCILYALFRKKMKRKEIRIVHFFFLVGAFRISAVISVRSFHRAAFGTFFARKKKKKKKKAKKH